MSLTLVVRFRRQYLPQNHNLSYVPISKSSSSPVSSSTQVLGAETYFSSTKSSHTNPRPDVSKTDSFVPDPITSQQPSARISRPEFYTGGAASRSGIATNIAGSDTDIFSVSNGFLSAPTLTASSDSRGTLYLGHNTSIYLPEFPKSTGAYGSGKGKPYLPTFNFTKGVPQFTGTVSAPKNDQGLLHPDCSGTHTIGSISTATYTSTITETEGTVTLTPGAPTPSAIIVSPLPFCTTYDYCAVRKCLDNAPFEEPSTTVLITKKTPAIVYTAQTVGPIFGFTTTTPPAQHIPQQTQDTGAYRTIPPAAPISQGHSEGQHSTPIVIAPGSNLGQLPGSLPDGHGLAGSGSTGSGISSTHGGSDQNGGGASGGIAHSGTVPHPHNAEGGGQSQETGLPSDHGLSQIPEDTSGDIGGGAFRGPSIPGSGSHSSNGEGSNSGVSGQIPHGEGSSAHGADTTHSQNGGTTSTDHHGDAIEPAIVLGPRTTSINSIPITIGSEGVVVGSHTIALGADSTSVAIDGVTFTIEPSRLIAGKTTLPLASLHTLPATFLTIGNNPIVLHPEDAVIASQTYKIGPSPTAITYNGQTFLLGSSQLVAAHSTIDLPHPSPAANLVTVGGEVFSVYSSQLEAPGMIVALPTRPTPSRFTQHGQTFTINPSQLMIPDREVPLPTITPAPSTIAANGIALSVFPSQVVIGSQTYSINARETPTSIVYHGQTINLGPNGCVLASTTIAIPPAQQSLSVYDQDGVAISIAASAVIIAGHTYALDPGMTPITTNIHGQRITISSSGVVFPQTTISIPSPQATLSVLTQGPIIFSANPSEIVLNGHSYFMTPGAKPTTTTIIGQEIVIGPSGIAFEGTTAALPRSTQTPKIVTTDGLTLSVGSTDAILQGKTYAIGSGAKPTTITVGDETLVFGPGGVVLHSKTASLPTSLRSQASATTSSSAATSPILSQPGQSNGKSINAGNALRISTSHAFMLVFLGTIAWIIS